MRRTFLALALLVGALPALGQKFSILDRVSPGAAGATGDIWYANTSTTIARLPVGPIGYVLYVSGVNVPVWGPPATIMGLLTRTDNFAGDGATTNFTATGVPVGDIEVSLNGLVQQASWWSSTGSTLTVSVAPISGAVISWTYYTVPPASTTQLQEDFTATGSSTDIVLAHEPMTIIFVARGGVVQTGTGWTLIAPKTIRFDTTPPSGTILSAIYRY